MRVALLTKFVTLSVVPVLSTYSFILVCRWRILVSASDGLVILRSEENKMPLFHTKYQRLKLTLHTAYILSFIGLILNLLPIKTNVNWQGLLNTTICLWYFVRIVTSLYDNIIYINNSNSNKAGSVIVIFTLRINNHERFKSYTMQRSWKGSWRFSLAKCSRVALNHCIKKLPCALSIIIWLQRNLATPVE